MGKRSAEPSPALLRSPDYRAMLGVSYSAAMHQKRFLVVLNDARFEIDAIDRADLANVLAEPNWHLAMELATSLTGFDVSEPSPRAIKALVEVVEERFTMAYRQVHQKAHDRSVKIAGLEKGVKEALPEVRKQRKKR